MRTRSNRGAGPAPNGSTTARWRSTKSVLASSSSISAVDPRWPWRAISASRPAIPPPAMMILGMSPRLGPHRRPAIRSFPHRDRLLETAADLTGAQYAALGILDDGRRELARFLTRGIDADTHRAIGDLPRGRGILGVLI